MIPVFNDWQPVQLLLHDLDQTISQLSESVHVVLIDDGSTVNSSDDLDRNSLTHIEKLSILTLRRNLGHQRALAVGLAYIESNCPCRAVVVMDGDGEDAPSDVPKLLQKFDEEQGDKIVFAARAKRSESWTFQIFYHLYRFVHHLLTGITVRVGNFSVIPFPLLSRLVVVSDLWNHYAASVHKARLPMTTIPIPRAERLGGQSKMNFVSLVTHGLSAISVFADLVGVRLLCATLLLFVGSLIALLGITLTQQIFDVRIPGWSAAVAGFIVLVMLLLIMLSLIFVFTILSGREGSSFLPIRDHVYFVLHMRTIDRNE